MGVYVMQVSLINPHTYSVYAKHLTQFLNIYCSRYPIIIAIISIKFNVHWKVVSLDSSLDYYLTWMALANHLNSLDFSYPVSSF